MISRCRAKSHIIQLKEDRHRQPETAHDTFVHPAWQRGIKGNIIIFPQRPSSVAKVLPPNVDDIASTICIIFIGSGRPTKEWLKTHAKPLVVRPGKIRRALEWLKSHNKWYKDIEINYELLRGLPSEFLLPVHIETVSHEDVDDGLTSGYNPDSSTVHDNPDELSTDSTSQLPPDIEISFQSVVVTDVDGTSTANDLRTAALRHIKRGGGYVSIGHDPTPVNEFFNPSLFPLIYPTLYPYGIGGFEDHKRCTPVSFKRHVKHLLSLSDRRFQEHNSFMFIAFNILQRREMLLRSSLKAKRSSFPVLAERFASVSAEAVREVAQRYALGDHCTFNTPEERTVLQLMREVNLVTAHVPWSSASLVAMRNEIRALMMDQGLLSFYVTINPADVYNPLVKFLAGPEIDIDKLFPSQVPKFWDQSLLIAKNPVIASQFFNIYLKAFISALLGFEECKFNPMGGILGVVKGYYGCIEAQGRGSLHCHMLIWLEGGLNPNEIRQRATDTSEHEFQSRLCAFLDDCISTSIPPLPEDPPEVPSNNFHSCSVRGTHMHGFNSTAMDSMQAKQTDLHNLALQCQVHTHTATCYKYCKNPSQPLECRFGLSEE
ncbi:hypothetical protein GYMLUDRAFT_179343, partial [Collybiopsis luxurians FD-317 M1]